MKSTRTALTLGYTKREEVEKGVFENVEKTFKVRAEQEKIFQSRKDKAKAESLVITARFVIRQNLAIDTLKYVEWKADKYKVSSVTPNVDNHFTVIELGELI